MTNVQQAASTQPVPAQTGAQLKEQIKQTMKEAQDAARQAAQEGNHPVLAGVPTPAAPPGFIMIPASDYSGNNDIPPQVVDISIAFFVMCAVLVIGWPLARAFGKRLERRGEAASASIGPGLSDQLHRIEQAVDAMSIEIERISESQRFIAKLQNAQSPERVALPADRR